MLIVRRLYCRDCRRIELHIIYCQKKDPTAYSHVALTAICLSPCCDARRHFTVSMTALGELCSRKVSDDPTSEGGI